MKKIVSLALVIVMLLGCFALASCGDKRVKIGVQSGTTGESFMKGNRGYSGLVWPLFFTAVYYLAFSGVVTILLAKLEKKLDFFR